ncbi:MAG: hypothetical protein AMXMBFR34_29130 [Myxococcaceae bacterium]
MLLSLALAPAVQALARHGRGAGKDGPKHSGAPGTRVGCGKNEPGASGKASF